MARLTDLPIGTLFSQIYRYLSSNSRLAVFCCESEQSAQPAMFAVLVTIRRGS